MFEVALEAVADRPSRNGSASPPSAGTRQSRRPSRSDSKTTQWSSGDQETLRPNVSKANSLVNCRASPVSADVHGGYSSSRSSKPFGSAKRTRRLVWSNVTVNRRRMPEPMFATPTSLSMLMNFTCGR